MYAQKYGCFLSLVLPRCTLPSLSLLLGTVLLLLLQLGCWDGSVPQLEWWWPSGDMLSLL